MSFFDCCCINNPEKPCNTFLSCGLYGCGGQNLDNGTVQITRPDGVVVTGKSGTATALNIKGTYTVTGFYNAPGNGTSYRSRTYSFTYDKCDGISYTIAMALTPTQVFLTGSICGNGGVNITASGAISGGTTSFNYLPITRNLEPGDTITYTGSKDRYVSKSVTVDTVSANLTDQPNRKFIASGATLRFCGADLSLVPEDCYTCYQDSTDPPSPNKGYFCEYPVTRYVTVNTPIGSVVAPLFGSAKLSYTGPTVTGCCTGPVQNKAVDFTVGGHGEVSYPTCFTGTQCGRPIPTDAGPECQGTGFGGTGSNQGNASDGGYCTRNQVSHCPPGLIFEFDTVDAAFLSGHYTITEQGCGPYQSDPDTPNGYGSDVSAQSLETYYVIPNVPKSSKRAKWSAKKS